jgi:hypothetical protein
MSGTRRGGIPGPESRTGLVRPVMTEAEFERAQRSQQPPGALATEPSAPNEPSESAGSIPIATPLQFDTEPAQRSVPTSRGRAPKPKATAKPRRVQRMFAIEEDVDKKLWLYAIHIGKDRSEVVNDLLRPLVASMVLYDSRDRRASVNVSAARGVGDGDGDLAA